jgi:hypothetical protein
MNRVSLPGFSAERSIYSDRGTFHTTAFGVSGFAGAEARPTRHAPGAVIEPQALLPAFKGCFTCRSSCFIRWRHNEIQLNRCLDLCPCDF